MIRLLLLILLLSTVGGCTTFLPVGTFLEIGEAAQAIEEDKQQPSTIETVIRKDDSGVVVESDSDKSLVTQPNIIQQSPGFNINKALDGVPTWLFIFNIILGIFVLINTLRIRKANNK